MYNLGSSRRPRKLVTRSNLLTRHSLSATQAYNFSTHAAPAFNEAVEFEIIIAARAQLALKLHRPLFFSYHPSALVALLPPRAPPPPRTASRDVLWSSRGRPAALARAHPNRGPIRVARPFPCVPARPVTD